jgi:hypothetical protein
MSPIPSYTLSPQNSVEAFRVRSTHRPGGIRAVEARPNRESSLKINDTARFFGKLDA